MFARNFLSVLLIMAVSICLLPSSSISAAATKSVAAWTAGTQYNVDDVVSYQGDIYTCRQAHTALANWAPPDVPALWSQLTSQQPPGIPAVPEGLAGTTVSSSAINVSWHASSGATGYDLEIDGVMKSNVTSPYTTTGLSANSTHKYKVRAKNAAGTSAWSSVISVSTGASDNNGGKTWGKRIFSPYVDVMSWPTFSINDTYAKTGQKYFTLAFVTSDSSGRGIPAWGGITPMSNDFYKDEINKIRSNGGDVMVSFGGANGRELALDSIDASTLQARYQEVIDRYKLTWIDFDIEGSAVADKASIDKRNKAIKGLQDKNPGLTVAFCLPVLPSGLTDDGLYVLTNAKANGVRVDVVNVMAMDYGDGAAPNPTGKMADYAMQAATSTYKQCTGIGLNPQIGITLMIGQNDTPSEIFYQADAKNLLSWAQSKSWVRLMAMWSVNRDNSKAGSLDQSTKIPQTDLEFTNMFKAFQ